MKRHGAIKSRINYSKPNDDKVVISSDYYKEERPSYICSICNRTLSRLSDAGGNNSTYWCRNCSVEFDPELENVRRESKISVPDRNIEPAVATTPGTDYLNQNVEIHHEPEIKGGLKTLKERGIKITYYEDSSQR
jgi:DNA-directed RNA polymerase subunit RPC12/RpoP